MAKYIGSPWGSIRGKLGGSVGGVWKAIEWVRRLSLPHQRGSLAYMTGVLAGLIHPGRFSWRQFNIKRLVFQVLGWLGRRNLTSWMYPVWQRLCDKHGYKLTHINLFLKRNIPTLWASLPDPDAKYDAVTNKPDMALLLVSDGDLEETPNFSALVYAPLTGVLTFTWDGTHTLNGDDTDEAYIMAYVEPIVDSRWRPNGRMYGTALVSASTRVAGSDTLTLPIGLTPGDICGYVYFKDTANIIGYSPSEGRRSV